MLVSSSCIFIVQSTFQTQRNPVYYDARRGKETHSHLRSSKNKCLHFFLKLLPKPFIDCPNSCVVAFSSPSLDLWLMLTRNVSRTKAVL